MAACRLDALLVTEKYNYWHLTGHLSREFDKKMRVLALVLPRDGRATLVVSSAEAATAGTACPHDALLAYDDVPFPPPLLARAIREAGLGDARVGAEFGANHRLGLALGQLDALRAALPGLTLVDASDLYDRLRMIKLPEEVDAIRTACRISLAA